MRRSDSTVHHASSGETAAQFDHRLNALTKMAVLAELISHHMQRAEDLELARQVCQRVRDLIADQVRLRAALHGRSTKTRTRRTATRCE
jgi:predicted DNA-binding protein